MSRPISFQVGLPSVAMIKLQHAKEFLSTLTSSEQDYASRVQLEGIHEELCKALKSLHQNQPATVKVACYKGGVA
jgi:hypothetical protein